ncbi:ATP-binding protein [Streptomyces sp. ME03-5709C]|nr:ATP-binding protein [Streptomyces sp. ME03-5709C]
MAAEPETTPRRAVVHVCAVSHIPGALTLLRRRVRSVLARCELRPEVLEDALLVISELTTNAIVHAEGPASLRIGWTDVDGRSALHIEVTDAGPAVRPGLPGGSSDPDEHGRGLGIVNALSTRHGIRSDRAGFTRWADLVTA